jgi:hypothetical protein
MVLSMAECRKRKYMTKKTAEGRLEQFRISESLGGRKRPEMRVYKCKDPDCGFWHLTSKPLRGEK